EGGNGNSAGMVPALNILEKRPGYPHIWVSLTPRETMRTQHRTGLPADIGFLLDELRLAGVTTYADLAATLNRQGIHPLRGRWTAHALHLAMRRQAAVNVGAVLYDRPAEEARRIIRRLQRRGLTTQALVARALNAKGLTTPGHGRPWTARSVSRVLAEPRRRRRRTAKLTLH